jgi:Cu2+-exporting ATPase
MAAGLFGISLSPMIGAAAMSLSSFSVVMNALRINRFDNKSLHYDDKNEENAAENLTASEKKGEEKMEITLKVEGMMCPHCEARVKEALSNVEGVESAFADHKSNEAKVVGNVDAEVLVSAVEVAGYKASVKK